MRKAAGEKDLLCRRKPSLVRVHEFGPGDLGLETNADEFSLWTAVTREREQILIVQMHLELIEIRFEGNWRGGTQKEGFAASFFRELTEIVLRVVGQEKGTAAVAGAGCIDAPKIDVSLFGDGNRGVHVGINGTEAGAEIINSGRNEKQRAWVSRRGPALHPVDDGKIRTGFGRPANRNTQCLRG